MPHWHEHNPWADVVVYVPLEQLAEAVAGGVIWSGDAARTYSAEFGVMSQFEIFGG